MRTFVRNIIGAGLTLGLVTIVQADALTNTTDRFLSGQLDTRIEELGTNKQTAEKMPIWKQTQLNGIIRHCTRTLQARGVTETSSCDRSF